MDEAQTQGRDEKREILPMTCGTPQREDAEEERKGTCQRCAHGNHSQGHTCSACHRVAHTAWADVLRDLIDGPAKDAEKSIFV
jgi:hypothetical protein